VAERLDLTIMDKIRCTLLDASLTPKLCPHTAHYAVLIYTNLSAAASDEVNRYIGPAQF
jgi:hypothetical protein